MIQGIVQTFEHLCIVQTLWSCVPHMTTVCKYLRMGLLLFLDIFQASNEVNGHLSGLTSDV